MILPNTHLMWYCRGTTTGRATVRIKVISLANAKGRLCRRGRRCLHSLCLGTLLPTLWSLFPLRGILGDKGPVGSGAVQGLRVGCGRFGLSLGFGGLFWQLWGLGLGLGCTLGVMLKSGTARAAKPVNRLIELLLGSTARLLQGRIFHGIPQAPTTC